MAHSRKDFLKRACLAGTCLCGFPSMLKANGPTEDTVDDSQQRFFQHWIANLLNAIADTAEEESCRRIIKQAAISHYEHLKMDEILAPYIGKLDDFNKFIENEWGWKIDYRKEDGVIVANENKNYCVCPILNSQQPRKAASLCYCSEGFAELMFSKVAGKKVNATVISSIHRGNDSCIYKIDLS